MNAFSSTSTIGAGAVASPAAMILSASYDKQIRFWDGATGRTIRCFSFQDSQVNSMTIIPSTNHLVVAGFGVLRVFDLTTSVSGSGAGGGGSGGTGSGFSGGSGGGGSGGAAGNQAPPMLASYENQAAMNFTSVGTIPLTAQIMDDSMRLLSGTFSMIDVSDGAGMAYSHDARAMLATLSGGGYGNVPSVLYATSEDGRIRFFSTQFSAGVPALRLLKEIPTGSAITCSKVSTNNMLLFTGSQIGRMHVWHLPSIMDGIQQSFAKKSFTKQKRGPSATVFPDDASPGSPMTETSKTVSVSADAELEKNRQDAPAEGLVSAARGDPASRAVHDGGSEVEDDGAGRHSPLAGDSPFPVEAVFASKPLQEVVFDDDYSALRSISMDPMATWVVVATNAGKLHFLRFSKQHRAPKRAIDDFSASVTTASCTQAAHSEAVEVGCGNDILTPRQLNDSLQPPALSETARVSEAGSESSAVKAAPAGVAVVAAATAGEADGKAKSHRNTWELYSPSSTTVPPLLRSSLQMDLALEEFHSFQAHNKYILKVEVSPNGAMLLTCSADYTVGKFSVPQALRPMPLKNTGVQTHVMTPQTFTKGGGPSPELEQPISFNNSSAKAAYDVESGNADLAPRGPPMAATLPCDGEATHGSVLHVSEAAAGNTQASSGSGFVPSAALDNGRSGVAHSASRAPSAAAGASAVAISENCAAAKEIDGSQDGHDVIHTPNTEGVNESISGIPNSSMSSMSTMQFTAMRPLVGHSRWVWDCVFSPCSNFVFTASSDNHVRMWTGIHAEKPQSTTFIGHTKPVVCVLLYMERKKTLSMAS